MIPFNKFSDLGAGHVILNVPALPVPSSAEETGGRASSRAWPEELRGRVPVHKTGINTGLIEVDSRLGIYYEEIEGEFFLRRTHYLGIDQRGVYAFAVVHGGL